MKSRPVLGTLLGSNVRNIPVIVSRGYARRIPTRNSYYLARIPYYCVHMFTQYY